MLFFFFVLVSWGSRPWSVERHKPSLSKQVYWSRGGCRGEPGIYQPRLCLQYHKTAELRALKAEQEWKGVLWKAEVRADLSKSSEPFIEQNNQPFSSHRKPTEGIDDALQLCCKTSLIAAVNCSNSQLENKDCVMSVTIMSLCDSVYTTILIKAEIWLQGSIPLPSPVIRPEGCQLRTLCCSLNSQASPLNWTPELSMWTACLPGAGLVFVFGESGSGERLGRLKWNVSLIHHPPSESGALRGMWDAEREGNGSL